MEESHGSEKAAESSFEKSFNEGVSAAEEAIKDVGKQAEKAWNAASEQVSEAVECLEKDLSDFGRKATEYGARNPLLVGVGLIAIAGVVLMSVLQAATTPRRK